MRDKQRIFNVAIESTSFEGGKSVKEIRTGVLEDRDFLLQFLVLLQALLVDFESLAFQ
jgi:hypothetical protein